MKTLNEQFARLASFVREVPEYLTIGYIGNIERWGDNRSHRIWVKGVNSDYMGYQNPVVLWSCDARDLTPTAIREAYGLVKAFRLGIQARTALTTA